jgi:tRNA C32,U32 (ribose-2'-O)-methylase TrmJ
VRSLNLANAVSIVLYEAIRKTSQESGVRSRAAGTAGIEENSSSTRLTTPESRLQTPD